MYHVFRQPPFFASKGRTEAESEAFLAEQTVPTITRSETDDFVAVGSVSDQDFFRIAWPRSVLLSAFEGTTYRMQTFNEFVAIPDAVKDSGGYSRHHSHGHRHVGRIGEFNSIFG